MNPPAAAPLARPPLALSIASFVSSFDRFAVSPMIVLIAADLGVSLSASVAAASGYYLAYGLTQPLWGVLSDRLGRVRVMRLALYGAAVAGAASALMPVLAALVVARVVTGACFGAVIPTSLTYVGDTVAPAVRQRALTDLMAAAALGTALATGLGGAVAGLVDWRVAFTVPAACALVCALGLRTLPEPPRAAGTGQGVAGYLGMVLRHRWALLVFGLAFTEGAIMLGAMPFLATALQHDGLAAAVAGLAITAYGLGLWAFSRLVKRVSVRWPAPVLMLVGGTQLCAGFALVSLHVSVPAVAVTALLLGGGWSFLHSSLQTWATSILPQARGTTIAFFAGALFVGSAVASWAAGPLAEHGRYGLLFGIAAAAAVPLTAVAAVTRRRYGALAAEGAHSG
ncbi:Predicted arabinose efflux permease, MFS family [Nonomuraea maritima]|uniref:Predicted arabinose efflux permease, MFS family n=1 Tax=Nonomuraea maritima TaxID=683260 RepID=A0A1G9CDI0_9ACTN|nr:MFS transporter [Nonomuraea maritima]SDK49719.1 Predicted arabinose efflux permease, MFS family [Nonomuraea maritima]